MGFYIYYMFIKSYNEFILESESYSIPAESDILKWTTEADGGDIDSFSKLCDIIDNATPHNYSDVRKVNLAHRGYKQCKTLFE